MHARQQQAGEKAENATAVSGGIGIVVTYITGGTVKGKGVLSRTLPMTLPMIRKYGGTDNWVSPWLSRVIMCGAKFWSVPRSPHVNSTNRNWYCLLFPNFPLWAPPKCPPHLIFRSMPRTLRLVSPLAASWQCQRCDRTNDSAKNKRRCSSCRAWRDGIAWSSAAGITIADAAVAAA